MKEGIILVISYRNNLPPLKNGRDYQLSLILTLIYVYLNNYFMRMNSFFLPL